jgi:hypothetical protein
MKCQDIKNILFRYFVIQDACRYSNPSLSLRPSPIDQRIVMYGASQNMTRRAKCDDFMRSGAYILDQAHILLTFMARALK